MPTSFRLLVSLIVLATLGGCAMAEQAVRDTARTPAAPAPSTATHDSWNRNAQQYRQGHGTHTQDCIPNAPEDARARPVWGSNPYTDDSSVCRAGVHAGVITYESGGRVTFEHLPGQNSYSGSTRNGVQTSDYGSYGGSFRILTR